MGRKEDGASSIDKNVDGEVVEGFGEEWRKFNYRDVTDGDLFPVFEQYFRLFPFAQLDSSAEGFDMGCGSGRWARFVAPKVGKLNCIDPSTVALEEAKKHLTPFKNVAFECSSAYASALEEGTQDFGYSLGVLHHIPDTLDGLKSCSRLLKQGAPFLLYLYYRFDNKPAWFRALWELSDAIRKIVSRLPFPVKFFVTQIIAVVVYFPVARFSLFVEKLGLKTTNIPLSEYRHKSLYFMRTDSLDRFGTKLEKRFTRAEIEPLLETAGFSKIQFSPEAPYWVALAYKS